jgi:hypothetical protein
MSAVLKVGEGRGFVVKRRRYKDCIVITAAHCLPVLPPPHPCAYLEEITYRRLLGPPTRSSARRYIPDQAQIQAEDCGPLNRAEGGHEISSASQHQARPHPCDIANASGRHDRLRPLAPRAFISFFVKKLCQARRRNLTLIACK